MNIRPGFIFFLIGMVLLAACQPPAPVDQFTPTAMPTVEALAVASATPDANVTPTDTAVSVPAGGWPGIVAEAELGISVDAILYPKPLAINSTGERVYVSGIPSQTLVLAADDLAMLETLDSGGNLAIDAVNNRLLIGVLDGLEVYNEKSGSRLAELSLVRLSDKPGTPVPVFVARLPAVPITSQANGDAFVVQKGLHRVSATGLYASDVLTEPLDIRTIVLDEARQTLYASINNGIPGSNNMNDLWEIKLKTRQARPIVGAVRDVAVDAANANLVVALTGRYGTLGALQLWSGSPLTVTQQLNNISGQLAVDEIHNRLYVLTTGESSRLMALQASTLAVIADIPLPGSFVSVALDATRDRLYLLSGDGQLLALSGHGSQPPAAQALEPAQPPSVLVTRLIISPDYERDKTILGIWSGSLPQGGTLLLSKDGGQTWSRAGSGLPDAPGVIDAAFSPEFARDQTLFAATLRGVYRSTDGGQSWQPASAGLTDLWVAQVIVSPAYARKPVLFARTFEGGLHRSVDGGQSWTWINGYSRHLDERAYTLALSPDFASDQTVYMSTGQAGGQVLVSRDAGDSWKPMAGGSAYALYVSGNAIFGIFERQGLMRSMDGGQSWSSAMRGVQEASKEDVLVLSSDFNRDRAALLLVRNSGQLYRTGDGGESWQASAAQLDGRPTTLAVWQPAGQPFDQASLWLGTADGRVVKVGDLEWSAADTGLPSQLDAIVLSPAFAQDGAAFVAGKESGVWASADGGQTWRDMGFPARETGIGRMHLAISPDFANDRTVFAATSSQLYRSTDGGGVWQSLPLDSSNQFPINALAISPNYASDRTVLVAGDYRAPTVLRSGDGGDTWQADAVGLPTAAGLNHMVFSPNFAADGGVYVWAELDGLYRSGDGGKTWALVYQPSGSWLVQSFALSPDFSRDRLMFLGTLKETHNVYRSADGGASWHPTELGLPLELAWASALAISPNYGRDRVMFLGTERGVYRSNDGGQSWRQAVSLPEVVALALSPGAVGDHNVFAISATDGLYMSTDGGEHWQPVER